MTAPRRPAKAGDPPRVAGGPVAVVKLTICSLCELDWERHTRLLRTSEEKVRAEHCVTLLKEDLAKRPFTSVIWNTEGVSGTVSQLPGLQIKGA